MPRRSAPRPVLVAAALLAVTHCSGSPEPEHGFKATAGPIRIMPLGDSNTTGTVGGGYRSDLWQLLRTDGIAADFVGSNTGGPAPLPDRNHEGHGGWTIARIDQHATAWLRTYRPDLVLLQILRALVTVACSGAEAGASDGAKVGDTYRAHIRADADSACTHNLSVNGGAPVVVRYPALGWEQWSVVRVDVPLKAGLNTLRFTKGTCYAEIDALDVDTEPLP